MSQRVHRGYVGGFVTEADQALTKYLATREGLSVSQLIRRWIAEEAQKPLVTGQKGEKNGQT
jgi:hypothetical protein